MRLTRWLNPASYNSLTKEDKINEYISQKSNCYEQLCCILPCRDSNYMLMGLIFQFSNYDNDDSTVYMLSSYICCNILMLLLDNIMFITMKYVYNCFCGLSQHSVQYHWMPSGLCMTKLAQDFCHGTITHSKHKYRIHCTSCYYI